MEFMTTEQLIKELRAPLRFSDAYNIFALATKAADRLETLQKQLDAKKPDVVTISQKIEISEEDLIRSFENALQQYTGQDMNFVMDAIREKIQRDGIAVNIEE